MKIKEYENYKIVELFKEKLTPELLERFFSKKISAPIGFYRPEYFQAHCAFKYLNGQDRREFIALKETFTTDHNVQLLTAGRRALIEQLVINQWPIYFVTESFCNAVNATDPPDFKLDSLHMPRNPITFCIPIGVEIAKVFPPQMHPAFVTIWDVPKTGNQSYIISIYVCNNNDFVGELFEISKGMECFDDVVKREVDNMYKYKAGVELENQSEATRAIIVWLFKLLLILNSRPALFTDGESYGKRKQAKWKSGEFAPVVYNPSFIGKNYKSHSEVTGEHHHSPVMHWRRGHIRNQACGKGYSQHKIIWIEPVLINAPNK